LHFTARTAPKVKADVRHNGKENEENEENRVADLRPYLDSTWTCRGFLRFGEARMAEVHIPIETGH